ncbi:MAG: hypothetical protein ACP5LM_02065 [Thermoplasmata archaeon]
MIFLFSLVYSISISELNVYPVGNMSISVFHGIFMNQTFKIINKGIYPIENVTIHYKIFQNNSLILENYSKINRIIGESFENISLYISRYHYNFIKNLILNGSQFLINLEIKGVYGYLIYFKVNFTKQFIFHEIMKYDILNYTKYLKNNTVYISIPIELTFYYNFKYNFTVYSELIYQNKTLSYYNTSSIMNNFNLIYLNFSIPEYEFLNINNKNINLFISIDINGIVLNIERYGI